MIEWGSSRLERILAEHGERWQIEREGLVWTATSIRAQHRCMSLWLMTLMS